MDWAIYGALVVGFLAVAGATALLVVRILQGWRQLKRFRRHLAKELDRLAELSTATADKAANAGDQAKLERSLASLRTDLARFAVIRAAIDETTDAVGRVTAVYPRK